MRVGIEGASTGRHPVTGANAGARVKKATLRGGTIVVALLTSQVYAASRVDAATVFPGSAIVASGTNGVGHITTPGLACGAGGSGAYREYFLESQLPPGEFSSLAATLRATVDVHTDPALSSISAGKNSFLLAANSHVTIGTDRGTVQLLLNGQGSGAGLGSCPQASMTFDGTTVTGTGRWTVGVATGAYRNASGNGTFTLSSALLPGANNPWSLTLTPSSFAVLEPALGVSVASTFWGDLGLDYASRIVSVTYNVTNTGPGDVFGAVLRSATSPTAGVTPLGPTPQALGDIASGASSQVTVRYQLGLLQPCVLAVLNCAFSSTLTVDLPDALDRDQVTSASVSAQAPATPPPL